jgi:REP element-mobilizing transposase RayT
MMADALPVEIQKEQERKKMLWCAHRGLSPHADRSEILDRLGPVHFMNYQRYVSVVYQKALDRGRGTCILAEPQHSKLVAEAILFQDRRRGLLFDFVVMPNHVHLLFQPHPEFSLKSVLDSIRSYSARQINHALGRKGKFWDREPFDHLVRSMHHFRKYQRYIRANPVKARLSQRHFFLHERHIEYEGVV